MRQLLLLVVLGMGCHPPSLAANFKKLGSNVGVRLGDPQTQQVVLATAATAMQAELANHPITDNHEHRDAAPAPAPAPETRPTVRDTVTVHHDVAVTAVLFQRVETASGVQCNKLDNADACEADCNTRMRQHATIAAGEDDGFRGCVCMQPEATGC